MTDSFKMILSYYDMACTPASVAPVVNIGTCVAMKGTVSESESGPSRKGNNPAHRLPDVRSG